MRRSAFIILACIVFLGGVLRVVNLSNNPPGFIADEAVIGVDAYSLIHHGADHAGNPPNFLFSGLGDYHGFVSIVSAIPFVSMFGLNEFAVRFTSAIYGILTIILIYAVTTIWFEESTALLAALFLAISPWHIHISRMGIEIASFPFLLLSAVYLLVRKTRYPSLFIVLSAVTFGVTLYDYQPARLFVPLFIGLLLFIYWKQRIRKEKLAFIGAGIVFFCMALPILLHLFSGESLARFQNTSIFFQSASWSKRIIEMLHTYINYFSYPFLFSKGDSGFPGQFITRHSVPGLGLLYLMQLPFLIAGIILSIRQWKVFRSQLLLAWLILYPIAGALVGNIVPFATRGIIGVIPMQILTAVGMYAFFQALARRAKRLIPWVALALLCAGLFSVCQYLVAWRQYEQTGANYWGWQYGARPIMEYFIQHQSQYEEMYMSSDGFNGGDIFIPFYNPTDNCGGKCRIGNPDKYDSQKIQLFAVPADRMNLEDPRIHVVQILYYPDNQPAFYIFEILQ